MINGEKNPEQPALCDSNGVEYTIEYCPYSLLTVIGQDDDGDYDESGYIAVVFGETAAIARYSHCSCYGTWTSLAGGGVSDWIESDNPQKWGWDWVGTVDELVEIATNKRDYTMVSRNIDENDYDYDHLSKVYQQIVEWQNTRGG